MNRHDYDRKIIAVFDTIGSFFVDVFYNDLFLKARDRTREGASASVTDAYKQNVTSYMRGIKDRSDLYMTVVKKLHEYYQQKSGFGLIVFADFENKIVSQFIPDEYFKDFTNKNKDKTLNEIVVETVLELGTFIMRPENLARIIDNHLDGANVSLLQDQIVEIFILLRENYYSKFAEKIGEVGANSVSKTIVVKLKKAFSDETQKRVKAETDRDRAINMLSGCLQKLKDNEELVNRLRYEIATLKKQAEDRPEGPSSVIAANVRTANVANTANALNAKPVKNARSGREQHREDDFNDVAAEFANIRAHKDVGRNDVNDNYAPFLRDDSNNPEHDRDNRNDVSPVPVRNIRRKRGGKEPTKTPTVVPSKSSKTTIAAANLSQLHPKTPAAGRKVVDESSSEEFDSTGDEDTNDEDFHRKQQEALKNRKQKGRTAKVSTREVETAPISENILDFDEDDPGWGA